MLAILVVIGTKYACNLDHVGDQICLQSWFKRGPNMTCNFSFDRNHICNTTAARRKRGGHGLKISQSIVYTRFLWRVVSFFDFGDLYRFFAFPVSDL